MTAEIVIMNKEAIALASDSAVTMVSESNHKIFTSANKLFALSYDNPIGIMVYQNATFMGIPWETIIKVYRNNYNGIKFDTLEEHAENFIQFLENSRELFPKSLQEKIFLSNIYSYFSHIKETIVNGVKSNIEKHDNSQIDIEDINKIVSDTIKDHHSLWINTENIPSIPKKINKKVIKKYKHDINAIVKEVFEQLHISDDNLNCLFEIASSLFSKFPESVSNNSYSGIVIAGFGEKDYFPSFKSYIVEFVTCDKLKYRVDKHKKIADEQNSVISPFAQREMVDMFMAGSDPSVVQVGITYLEESLKGFTDMILNDIDMHEGEDKETFKEILINNNEILVERYITNLRDYQQEKHISPVINVVSMLPKDELALMAESLVNLTSFKRKVSIGAETVAGPIDVAVISKGD